MGEAKEAGAKVEEDDADEAVLVISEARKIESRIDAATGFPCFRERNTKVPTPLSALGRSAGAKIGVGTDDGSFKLRAGIAGQAAEFCSALRDKADRIT